MWIIYIIVCSKDNSLYTGITNNLNKRLEESSVDTDSFKDFIYQHNLYGKVDKNNNSITIISDSLKQLNFIVLFEDLLSRSTLFENQSLVYLL